MNPPVPENTSFHRETVIRELAFGHDLAKQLRGALCSPAGVDGLLNSSKVLVQKIMGSFEAALDTLNSEPALEVCSDPVNAGLISYSSGQYRCSQDSREPKDASKYKQHRGGPRRRKTSGTWTITSATPFEDGHVWRKYGEKVITGSKFTRCYFRCTYRNELECLATKQVQKTDDNPTMYHITYLGHHICKDLLKASELLDDFVSSPNRSFYLNFESGSTTINQAHPSPSFTFPKQDDNEQLFTDLIHDRPPEELLLPELSPCEMTATRLSNAASDGSDIFSSMYMMEVPDEIDDLFHFYDEFNCVKLLL